MIPDNWESMIPAWTHYWSEHLRVNDWDIAVKVVKLKELAELDPTSEDGETDCDGMCQTHTSHRSARIFLLHPGDHPKDSWSPHDIECVLVHELLHIVLARISRSSSCPDVIDIEQVVSMLAKLLVKLNRGGGNGLADQWG